MDKYVLRGKKAVKAVDLTEWAIQFEKGDQRRVAQTELPNGVKISTVFLGLDHAWGDGPPQIFETMIFDGLHDGYCERYSTWEEAEAGHEKAVLLAKEAA